MNNNWKLKFAVIWTGQIVSFFTSAILQMALIWHLTILTNSAAILAIASIAGFLPMAILGSFAGAYVDRWNKKLTMIGADLFIALISFSLFVFAFFAEVPIWFVLAVILVRSIGTALHTPAISAVTPLIVPEMHLTKCAGLTQTVQTFGYIAGTAVAAVLYPLWGVKGMVALDVVGAIVASLAVVFIKINEPKVEVKQEEQTKIWFEIKEGYKALKASKGLFALLWTGFVFSILFAPVNALFPLFSLDYFGGTTIHASIAEIIFAVGMMIGGVIIGAWGGFKNRSTTMILATLLVGLAVGFSGILPTTGFVFFAVFSFLIGFASPFYTALQTGLMQERIASEYLGRVFGLYGSLASIAMLAGLALTGAFADLLGVSIYFLIAGVVICLLALVMFIIPAIRNIEKENK